MIGKIITGKSFNGCLKYCLNDKLSEEEFGEQALKNRAEVLVFNQCFGNEKELIQQFNEVRNLNRKLSKPVMHITLSFAPGEQLSKYKLGEICEDCAKEMGFNKNQFVAIYHNDTRHQHVHIVANRIGFDGKTLSDSNNYKKVADYCRCTELKYHLRQVLSPKKFLSKELRQTNRQDQRKDKLKTDIKESLLKAFNFHEFEQRMRALKYEVIKSRGIAFRDKQKVYTKGSDVGFSLSRIEKLLELKPSLKVQLFHKEEKIIAQQKQDSRPKNNLQIIKTNTPDLTGNGESDMKIADEFIKINSNALEILMANEKSMSVPRELTEEEKRRRKLKQRRSM
ncbi:relaxase/mobilization nuclease domain-containing protein [Pinibacter soli]|uniref:Relaxase/mobilization nuclease domain-containing protein n=1 Tax=Pinibacter soli TaxID=3044211 RepID=A0ABT6RFG5_9BACT|nr:relaxase/mobilization nuclease domain-containing protein [Pinibacter soli]MDI3321311.1 relaxase/mobilization nuclease domain-containing protein [Pinibacter soli]